MKCATDPFKMSYNNNRTTLIYICMHIYTQMNVKYSTRGASPVENGTSGGVCWHIRVSLAVRVISRNSSCISKPANSIPTTANRMRSITCVRCASLNSQTFERVNSLKTAFTVMLSCYLWAPTTRWNMRVGFAPHLYSYFFSSSICQTECRHHVSLEVRLEWINRQRRRRRGDDVV